MPIAIDASSPAVVTGFSSAVSASFTAPADSFLVALSAFTAGIGTNSIVNSGTGLTWTLREVSSTYDAMPSIFTASAPVSVARTVTAQTTTPSALVALKLLVVTGADLTAPVGAVGAGDSTTQNLTAAVYTSTVAGSRAVGIATDSVGNATPTSSDVGFGFELDYTGVAVYKATDTATPGSGVTLNFNGTGASRNWDWAAIEILPKVAPFLASRGRILGQAVNRAATY